MSTIQVSRWVLLSCCGSALFACGGGSASGASGIIAAPRDWVGTFEGNATSSPFYGSGTLTIAGTGALTGHIENSPSTGGTFSCDVTITPKAGTNQASVNAVAGHCSGQGGSGPTVALTATGKAVLEGDLLTMVGNYGYGGLAMVQFTITAIRQ